MLAAEYVQNRRHEAELAPAERVGGELGGKGLLHDILFMPGFDLLPGVQPERQPYEPGILKDQVEPFCAGLGSVPVYATATGMPGTPIILANWDSGVD